MDAPLQEEMKEGKVSRAVEAVSEAVSIISRVARIFPKEETLEDIIKSISGTQSLSVDYETNVKFADKVLDYNPLHRDKDYAKKKGHKDVAVLGTLLASDVEQYVLSILHNINNLKDLTGKIFYDTHYDISFRNFFYIGDEGSWRVNSVKVPDKNEKDESDLILNISLPKVIKNYVTCNVTFSSKMPTLGYYFKDHFLANDELAPKEFWNIQISEKDSSTFYQLFGKDVKPGVPKMYVASLFPAALLKIAEERTGAQEGNFLSTHTDFYDEPVPGNFKTKVILTKQPSKRKDAFTYEFEGLVYQRETEENKAKLILKSTARVLSPAEFKF